MTEEKKDDLNKNTSVDIDKELDILWNNWASRRRCERTHVPEYIKKNKGGKKNE